MIPPMRNPLAVPSAPETGYEQMFADRERRERISFKIVRREFIPQDDLAGDIKQSRRIRGYLWL